MRAFSRSFSRFSSRFSSGSLTGRSLTDLGSYNIRGNHKVGDSHNIRRAATAQHDQNVRDTQGSREGVNVRRAATALVASSALLLGACSSGDDYTPSVDAGAGPFQNGKSAEPVKGTDLPIGERAELTGQGSMEPCPYIENEWLQNTTGQRLTGVGVDNRFDPPACVFWSYEQDPQAQVIVRKMTSNADAVAVVDDAAPIDSTLKTLEPEGWSGGRQGDPETGSVYAVWKDEVAVVVFTAQGQSLKAQQIAEETITNLGL